jgi:putative flippase GtrA
MSEICTVARGTSPLGHLFAWFRFSPRVLAKAVRFTCVGLINGAVFAMTTAAMIHLTGFAPTPASVVGYCVSVPVGFIGHRNFAFRSSGNRWWQLLRFGLVQLANIAITGGAMAAMVERFHLHYLWGIAAAIVLVPVINFFLAHLWIFREQQQVQL